MYLRWLSKLGTPLPGGHTNKAGQQHYEPLTCLYSPNYHKQRVMINTKTRGELRKMHMEVDSELVTGQGVQRCPQQSREATRPAVPSSGPAVQQPSIRASASALLGQLHIGAGDGDSRLPSGDSDATIAI